MGPITKTAVLAGSACDVRAYRQIVRGEYGNAPAPAPNEFLIAYRARHTAVAALHRLLSQRRAVVDENVLGDLWKAAWVRAGGEAEPNPAGLAWLVRYARENPFIGAVEGRRIVAVEYTLQNVFDGRVFQARPDVLAEDPDGTVVALELSSAKHPTLDVLATHMMAAIDGIVLRGPQVPPRMRDCWHRVVVADLNTYEMIDITMDWEDVQDHLRSVLDWLDALRPDDLKATSTLDTCSRCSFRDDCPESFILPYRAT